MNGTKPANPAKAAQRPFAGTMLSKSFSLKLKNN